MSRRLPSSLISQLHNQDAIQTRAERFLSIAAGVLDDRGETFTALRRGVAAVPGFQPGQGDMIGQGQVADEEGCEGKGDVIPTLAKSAMRQAPHVGGDS